jgi:hypothetical protein
MSHEHKCQCGFVIRPLKLATQTCELLSTVSMNFHNVSHKALAYILIKTLFVVMYRAVRSLVHEIIQETDKPRGKPVHLGWFCNALSRDSPARKPCWVSNLISSKEDLQCQCAKSWICIRNNLNRCKQLEHSNQM